MDQKIRINAVAYQEGDAWIVQGIEFDIVAHAYDVKALPDAFARAVIENVCITEYLGRKPLAGISPAPERFRELFDDAAIEMRNTRPSEGPEVSIRLAG